MQDVIDRALGYPYDVPKQSYIWRDGGCSSWQNPDLTGRFPVLACGSNQSAQQLSRKFSGTNLGEVPVMAGWIDGVDSVYSAHFSAYGSIPATSLRQAGVRSRQAITWLTPQQLDRMHETEALGENYTYEVWEAEAFHGDCGYIVERFGLYLSLHGVYAPQGRPVGLAAIEAKGRTYPAYHQEQLQKNFLQAVGTDQSVGDLIISNVQNQTDRDRNKNFLKKTVLLRAE